MGLQSPFKTFYTADIISEGGEFLNFHSKSKVQLASFDGKI